MDQKNITSASAISNFFEKNRRLMSSKKPYMSAESKPICTTAKPSFEISVESDCST